MSSLCPSPEDLSRAFAHGATAGLVEHLAGCERCSDEWDGALRLRALVRSLPEPAPTRRSAADLRARIVAEAVVVRRRARRASGAVAVFAAFAAAAAVALAIGLPKSAPRSVPEAPSARRHGVVTATPGARYSLFSAAPDEVVLLESGTIHVEVSPLGAGERFRVRTADGEVEVRGTAFDVAVESGHLNSVTVEHGRVEVRAAGGSGATLTAGDGWTAAPLAAPAATASVPADRGGSAADSVDHLPGAAAHVRSGSASAQRHVAASPSQASGEGSATASVESPPAESRDTPPSRLSAAPVSPAVNAPTKVSPPATTAAPEAAPSIPAPAHDSRDHDDERRERREERRERYDQRRMR